MNKNPQLYNKPKDRKNVSSYVIVHDYFNLVTLLLIISILLVYLYKATDFSKIGDEDLGKKYIHIFHIFFYIFVIYLIVDTIWIYLHPQCVVTDSKGILIHHLLCIPLCLVPWFHPRYSWHMMFSLTTEINTFIIILRRQLEQGTALHKICDFCFYVTWILLKIILFPFLVLFYGWEYHNYSMQCGTYLNLTLTAPAILFLLTILTFYWTYLLLVKTYTSKDIKIKGS